MPPPPQTLILPEASEVSDEFTEVGVLSQPQAGDPGLLPTVQ
jgi:hypothetical protein